TPMQTTFGVNMVALVDGVPRTLSLKELIQHYVAHQREVVTRRTQYELRRASKDPEAARLGLVERFALSAVQAQAILDMRLQRLTALEAEKVRAEHRELVERIAELRAILGDPAR